MKSKISIRELVEEAEVHERIAADCRRIAESLKGLNPNVELLISGTKPLTDQPESEGIHAQRNGTNSHPSTLTKQDALVQVLKSSGKSMKKDDIQIAMKSLGHEITAETLTSYLSRNKGKLFKNPRRGVWKLADQTSLATAA